MTALRSAPSTYSMTMKYVLSPTPMSKTWTQFECERCARQPRLVEEHRDELLLLGEVRQDALDRDAS